MRCANPKCTRLFRPISAKHTFCSPSCGATARRHELQEEERARFINAPGFPVPSELMLQLAERHSEDAKIAIIIDRFKPAGARFVRFGCPKLDRENDSDFDFMLRWFPARGHADLEERHGDQVSLNVATIPLPRKATYVIAYFDTDYRLIEPWKYKIYIDFFHPHAPWYAGDRTAVLKR